MRTSTLLEFEPEEDCYTATQWEHLYNYKTTQRLEKAAVVDVDGLGVGSLTEQTHYILASGSNQHASCNKTGHDTVINNLSRTHGALIHDSGSKSGMRLVKKQLEGWRVSRLTRANLLHSAASAIGCFQLHLRGVHQSVKIRMDKFLERRGIGRGVRWSRNLCG